jgi:hypothetical protein
MIILHMGEMRENVVFSTEANAEDAKDTECSGI